MLKAQQVYGPGPPAIRTEGAIALGRRLFQTLPEDAHDKAPVTGGDGRWTLVADVRLEDRQGLGAALGIAAPEAAILSDAALVMKAIEHWEEEAIGRLVGDFALALWDAGRGRLLLARDFMGHRPLHYHRGAGFFAFASMPKGLHALPEVPLGPDERAIGDFLALMRHGGSHSFFKGIERVLPGEMCIVGESGLTTRRHWTYSAEPLRLKSRGEYAEALRDTFDQAVGARLRGSGGRVAAHLSGGLDSGTVAATAARLLAPGGSVTAFTAVPRSGYGGKARRGRFIDEGPHAAAVAALYPNMEHVLVDTQGRSPLASLDRNFFLYEAPLINLCNAVWGDAIADEAKRRGHRVLLTGQMGNFSFSYTGTERLSDLLGRGKLLALAREAFHLRRRGMPLESLAAQLFGPFMPARLWVAAHRWRGRKISLLDHSAVRPEALEKLQREAARRGVDLAARPPRDSVTARIAALGRVDIGAYQKGALGGWGLDVRDPTADRRLVELCLSIPLDQYLVDGRSRALARTAFADRLPAMVVEEFRKGYQAADWHEGLLAAQAEGRREVERIAAVPAAGPIDSERLGALIDSLDKADFSAPEAEAHYRLALLRGVSLGHFVRKATGSN